MAENAKRLAAEWLRQDRCEATRSEVTALVEAENWDRLTQLMSTRMEFGTAGLRAEMGAGFSRMNELTIVQTAQGFSKYLREQWSPEDLAQRGVVLGFDARHQSHRFAKLSAHVLLGAGIKVRLYRQICPTPFVPFAIKQYSCVAGVMVTASHNPKQDNGYKVYWANGAQIISPHDKGIAAAIEASLEVSDSTWLATGSEPAGVIDAFDEINDLYFASLGKEVAPVNAAFNLVYTAMHGVGTEFIQKALASISFPASQLFLVEKQCTPDPEFPTVAFPNPEEGKSALDLSFSTANANNANVILANDPDADRLAVAEKVDGTWRVFTGNEIGALLGWWCLQKEKKQSSDFSRCLMLASTVSSSILGSMAKKEGFQFQETLTGFKWMGSWSERRMREDGLKVLFAFEEAIGFMCGTRVLDKDGVTAAAVLCELLAFLNGKTLSSQLEAIFAEYGYHESSNSYVVSRDTQKTNEMFQSMRTGGSGVNGYPATVAGAKVISIRDLTTGFDSTKDDKKAVLPTSKSSNMITFGLDNGVTITIRGSGTEPKIKWYSERISATKPEPHSLDKFTQAAVDELMRPEVYGFKARSS